MKHKKPSKELQSLFNQEWKRAKKILKPFFDETKKPKLYVGKLRKWYGYHSGNDRTFMQKINGRWVKTAHRIVLSEDLESPQLVKTIRHEICHVKYQNHGQEFQRTLKGLLE